MWGSGGRGGQGWGGGGPAAPASVLHATPKQTRCEEKDRRVFPVFLCSQRVTHQL